MAKDYSSSNKLIVKNTLLLYFRMLITMIVTLYTSRLVLDTLGITDYGIYNVVAGVVVIMGFLNGTMNTTASRFITVSLGKDDKDKMSDIFNSIFIVNLLFGIIIVILCETVGLWLLYNKMQIPEQRLNVAGWIYQMSVFTVFVNIMCIPYGACIVAHEKMKAFAYISLMDVTLKLGCVFLIINVNNFDSLLLYAISLMGIQLLDQFIYVRYCVVNFEEAKIKFKYDKKLLKEIFGFISWSSYGSLVSVGFTQGLNVLLNMFFGPVINAARGVAVQVQNAAVGFATNFQNAINPQLMKSVSTSEHERSRMLLISSSKYSFYLLCIICLPIIVEVGYILSLWLKEVPEKANIFVQLMLIFSLFFSISNPLRITNQAEGNIKKYQLYECTALLMIVPVSYLALKLNAIPESVFIIQVVIEILTNFIRIKIVLPKIKMSIKEYMYGVYARILPTFLIPLSLGILIAHILPSSFFRFIINSLVVVISTILCIYFIGLSHTERFIVIDYARKTFSNLIKRD